ncbi:alcohol dehydrogenase [Bryobacterales bacterium F-183]|nr:alcohol dehydrogenase [Bryobacterales bacterium F-183]
MQSVHIERGKVSIRETVKPKRGKSQAILKLIAGGICNTDLELLRGYYSFKGTPGHEFVAEVVDADSKKWVGKRVVGEINAACGKCEWCRKKLGRHCPDRTVLGIVNHPGAFAEFFTLPEANLLEVPKGVRDEHAVFTEPVAAACEILEQVRIAKDEPVAVLGDGKLGLLIAQVLRAAAGAKVTLYGKHKSKLAIAADMGIQTVITEKLPEGAYAKVVEATGSAAGLEQAVRMTRPRGHVIAKSTIHGKTTLDMAPVVVNEISIVGSRCGRFEPALRLIKGRKLNLDPMLNGGEFALPDAAQAFAKAQQRGILKVLLRNA